MADTTFAKDSAQAVQWYSKKTMVETLQKAYISKLMGKSGDLDACIVRLEDLDKSAGEKIRYDLLMAPVGTGATGDEVLEYYEEAMVYHQDSVYIDQKRNAHAWGRMTQQRTLHQLRGDAKSNLSGWMGETIYDQFMFNNLCGDTTHNFGQAAVAPDGEHYIVAGDVTHTGVIATDEASLGSNDQIGLVDLDYAKEKAETISPKMVKATYDGQKFFVVLLHNYSAVDIRLNTVGSSYTKWQDIQQYANNRGLKNPIFTDALGVYNGMILLEAPRIVGFDGAAADTVRRNLFLGKQAGVFAVGSAYDKMDEQKYGKLPMSWDESARDYRNRKGIAVGSIFGIKACIFNGKRFGSMVITAYSIQH